jgi:hypothetical protein
MTRTELLNALIVKNNYEKYLEIGVNTPAQPGYNWSGINAKLKHGVDPNVETTFSVTSDYFFKNIAAIKYDIIFVDGLHIFEQSYKDIINGLQFLNDGGTIVVHDCNPINEITQRRERASDVWHGDVWKAILKLRTERSDLNIKTVDTDEGCAVIQMGKSSILNMEPIFEYQFLEKNRKEILNLISVDEFIKLYL